MGIERVNDARTNPIVVTGGNDRRKAATSAPAPRREAGEAMTVELSPAARVAAATSAITTANRDAAASTDWFAGAGDGALRGLRRPNR